MLLHRRLSGNTAVAIVVVTVVVLVILNHFSKKHLHSARPFLSQGFDTSRDVDQDAGVGHPDQYYEKCLPPGPAHIETRHGVWQVAHVNGGDVILYGAYYDNRTTLPQSPVIRMFGITNITDLSSLSCHIWLGNASHPTVAKVTAVSVGRGMDVDGSKYTETLFYCPVTVITTIPSRISITDNPCRKSTILLPVTVPTQVPVEKRIELGMCVATAFGYLNPTKLVEWIEFNHLLGVSEIVIYNSSVAEPALKVLRHYAQLGLVDLRHAPQPVQHEGTWEKKLATISVLNDCLYRNMYRYKYLAVIDFDEMIIPKMDRTYHELFQRLELQYPSAPAYIFLNAYFFLNFESDPSQPAYLTTMAHLTRIDPSDVGYSSKSVTKPVGCIVLLNHNCHIRTPDVGLVWTRPVKSDFALSHHYKYCHYDSISCKREMKSHKKDEATLKYHDDLLSRVKVKLEELKLLQL